MGSDTLSWLQILEKFGLPMIILAFFAYFVAKSVKWLGDNVIMSLQQRHIAFLDKIESQMSEIKASHEELRAAQLETHQTLEEMVDVLEDVCEFLGMESSDVDDVEEKPKKPRRNQS